MKTLITLAILASSSVAFAQPAVRDHRDLPPVSDGYDADATFHGSASVGGSIDVRDHRDAPVVQDHTHVRDHRQDMMIVPGPDIMRARIRMMRPVTLATDATFIHDHRDHSSKYMYIALDGHQGAFKRLRLDREQGRAYIDNVVVMLPNGRSQTYTVRQMLNARNPSLVIDLDYRAITGIYIYGTSMRGRASFDVIGLRR